MPDFEPIPYRIRIGVTGHRNPEDPAKLRALVRQAIDTKVRELFPAQSRARVQQIEEAGVTKISYRVLTPLAEGTDRVVAQAILDDPGARLDAVLPLVLEDYLEDFATEESRTEFKTLLAMSRKPVHLRTQRIACEREDKAAQKELRRDAYTKAGQYVVDHCDVLIAYWDGEPARGRGGTAEIVEYATQQKRPILRIWGDTADVLQANNNGLDASALDAIDSFNWQPIPAEQRATYVSSLNDKHFVAPETAGNIPADVRQLVKDGLFPYYAQASIVAKQSQRRFYGAGKYAYFLSAAAVGCAALGVLSPQHGWIGFGVELLLLVVLLLTLKLARRRQSQQHWIEYRFLTERLRCAIFMAICGVEPSPIEVLPSMGHSQTVNDWTVRVFDEIWDRLPRLVLCSADECLILNQYVRDEWIGDQVTFHRGKAAREGLAWERIEHAGIVVLSVTIAAAAFHLLMPLWQLAQTASERIQILHDGVHQGLSFIALLFPAIAASLAGTEAQHEHLRLQKSSVNMAVQLERICLQLESATDPDRFQSLLRQADDIMLRENQGWLMLMRFVEIKAS